MLLTLALCLSTRLPAIGAGAICVVLFGLGWMAGVFAVIGRFFDAAPLVSAAEASRWLLPSDGLWRGTIFGLEPPALVLHRGREGTRGPEPVLRIGPAADAVPRVVGRLGRDRPRPGRRLLCPARPLGVEAASSRARPGYHRPR